MYIRDLQSRVQFIRADIQPGFVQQALQDSARYVARKTGIITTKVYGVVPSGYSAITLTDFINASALECDVLRPVSVMYYPGLSISAYALGVINSDAASIANASSSNKNGYYVANKACVVTDASSHAYSLKLGDVLYSSGTTWQTMVASKYAVAKDLSKKRVYNVEPAPLNSNGYLGGYMVGKNEVQFRPIPNRDTPVMIECSIVPKKDFDNADFPVEAEDAIIAYAKAQIYSLPNKSGGGADHNMAARMSLLADGEISLLRAIAEGGYGNAEMAPPPVFGV